jgi:hypothetical protein
MKPLCEVIVQKILPGIRATVALKLIEDYKMSQSEAAKRLGVSQPAISQYFRQLRGENVQILKNKKVDERITEICGKIAEGMDHIELVGEFCRLCNLITSSGLICDLHKEMYPKIKECSICPKCL